MTGFELAAIKAALEANKPILGVCRGLQLLNVYFGGTLYQDLSLTSSQIKHLQSPTPQEVPTHHISVEKESSLGFLPENYMVNSFHHQVIKDLGQGLQAIAHGNDGLVEAIENKEKHVLAVQWHPECTWETEHFDKKIFEIFANGTI